MENLLANLPEIAVTYTLHIVAAVVIFFIGKWIARRISNFVEKLMKRSEVDPALTAITKKAVYVGILVIVIVATLSKLGVQTASIIAAVGATGLGVGLAMQGALANFAAGILLTVFKPFRIGDFIEANGEKGTVEAIRIFTTTIIALDYRIIVVPNAKVTEGNLINYSGIGKRRIDLTFGISYGDDPKKAKEVLMDIMMNDPRVLKDPPPFVGVWELHDNSVDLAFRPWVKPEDYWPVYFDMMESVKTGLKENGITIPFPQRVVHIYQEK